MDELALLNIPLVEWIGYLASALILISLSLSSILRLRAVNLAGAVVFSFYGFFIGSLPVGIMNLVIVFANIYHLWKLYSKKENFELIETSIQQEYIQKFLAYYKKDIQKYFPGFEAQETGQHLVLMLMRNMKLAGLFIAKSKEGMLEVELDYVTPEFRDYKNGIFLFGHFRKALADKKITSIVARPAGPQQIKYLKKMGFSQDSSKPGSQTYHLHLKH